MPPPTERDLETHYKNYHDLNHQASDKKNKQRAFSYKQEVKWIEKKIKKSKIDNIFDYGASGGYFLDELSKSSITKKSKIFGYDESESARFILEEKKYFKLLGDVNEDSLDFASMRGVLEHLLDFKKILKELLSKVKKEGYFFITATPDSSSTVANVYRSEWVQHHYPSHFQHFNSSLVDILLAENNFYPFAVADLYEKSIYRSEKDAAHWLEKVIYNKTPPSHAFWGSMMTRLYKKA